MIIVCVFFFSVGSCECEVRVVCCNMRDSPQLSRWRKPILRALFFSGGATHSLRHYKNTRACQSRLKCVPCDMRALDTTTTRENVNRPVSLSLSLWYRSITACSHDQVGFSPSLSLSPFLPFFFSLLSRLPNMLITTSNHTIINYIQQNYIFFSFIWKCITNG